MAFISSAEKPSKDIKSRLFFMNKKGLGYCMFLGISCVGYLETLVFHEYEDGRNLVGEHVGVGRGCQPFTCNTTAVYYIFTSIIITSRKVIIL
jgi:hypothetical protein